MAVAACAVAALSFASTGASAAAYTFQPANAAGSYYTDAGNVTNTAHGQAFPTSDGSSFIFVSCVGEEPGQPGCSVPGQPPYEPNAWYKWPTLPTSAAAQAHAPDFGIARARAWSSGTHGVGTGAPGFTSYLGSANAGWRDEINTTAALPITITFVIALHANWNDGGVLALQMGRPGAYNPDVSPSQEMDGRTWTNCAACVFGYDTGSARTVLPGGANGFVDQIVTLDFTVLPNSFADPEDLTPFTNPFVAILLAGATANDAEVDAFSTVTLQRIIVPPNAGLSFASGHTYNLQVVPEPETWALWLLGLGGVAFRVRARRSLR